VGDYYIVWPSVETPGGLEHDFNDLDPDLGAQHDIPITGPFPLSLSLIIIKKKE
jgi:hypothetical protein